MDHYDLLVIGAGPGGYTAAIRAAQLGMKAACVDAFRDPAGRPALGGTCLNVGCIPSKALLDSSHHFYHIAHEAKAHGIAVEGLSLDLPVMQERKDRVVRTLTQGIAGLFKRHGIAWLQGQGRLKGEGRVEITSSSGEAPLLVSARHIVIATGSVPATLPGIAIDNDRICDSTGALDFTEVPERLGVIGAGVIGLELGSVWRRLGSEVVLLEALDEWLPSADLDITRVALKELTRQGLQIRLGCPVEGIERQGREVQVSYRSAGGLERLAVDRLIVAVGRRPQTEGLGLAEAGVELDPRGFIEVDRHGRTTADGVYAVGDCTPGPMLAHKASEEGVAVVERIAGQSPAVDHALIPWVIYTWPEIAWVGRSEQALESEGRPYRAGRFPLQASGRARAMGESAGLVKVIADARTDRVLGVHIFAPQASELVAEAVLALAFEASAEDLARTVHAHPTLAETMHEAALAVDGRPINL
jgi:dihydrolipoamide dehydrogenase